VEGVAPGESVGVFVGERAKEAGSRVGVGALAEEAQGL
jgi:hypothetical protein